MVVNFTILIFFEADDVFWDRADSVEIEIRLRSCVVRTLPVACAYHRVVAFKIFRNLFCSVPNRNIP